jgi:peptidoglycan/xylan/chitin deacetylase (PgdA/CDA1 family)
MALVTNETAGVVPDLAKRAATLMLRSTTVHRAVRALARARGHRLVLVYHRLGPPVAPGCQVVPSVPFEMFKAQLQALGEIVDLLTLDEILRAEGQKESIGRRPAVAITFDDDLPSHASQALPALREMGVRATFFLSGRALNGVGPYWFQDLEALLVTHGRTRTASLLGLSAASADQPAALVIACERDAGLRRRVVELSPGSRDHGVLEPDAIAALAAGGMTIGFHTVDHHPLPGLADTDMEMAVTRGRDRLAAAAGGPLHYFAYPHGKADDRSVGAVRRAGFDAAFTGRPEPLRPRADRHRIGRWEPGPLAVDDFLVKLAVRLHRAAPAGRRDS